MTSETADPALPDDVAQCHALIAQLTATLHEQEREKARLMHRVEMLLQQIYGRRSERIDPAQLLLFVEQVMAAAEQVEAEPEPETGETPPRRKGHGRQKLPVELPRLPIEHPVSDSDKVCAQCGKDKTRIGQDVSEQLEYARPRSSSSNTSGPNTPAPAARKASPRRPNRPSPSKRVCLARR